MRLRTTGLAAATIALAISGTLTDVASATGTSGAGFVFPPLPSGNGRLYGTTQVDAHTTWAYGRHQTPGPRAGIFLGTPMLLSLDDRDGRGWQEVPLPASSSSEEIDAAAVVPGSRGKDAWLVGGVSADGDSLLADHWDGTSWQSADVPLGVPNAGAGLSAVTARAADDVWAAGWVDVVDSATPTPGKPGGTTYVMHFEALLEHWDGNAWHRIAVPGQVDSVFTSVAVRGSGDVWTAGYGPGDTPVIQHFDGTSWTPEVVPKTGIAGEIYQMGADADGSLVAVGRTVLDQDDPGHALVLRRVGGHWRQVPVPASAGQLHSVAFTPGGMTVAGEIGDSPSGYAMRLVGSHWTRLSLPATDVPVLGIMGVSYSPLHGLTLVGDTWPDGTVDSQLPMVATGR